MAGGKMFNSKLKTQNSKLKGQSTLEYAVLIAVVAGAIAAMHTYVQRGVQANLKIIEQQINIEVVK